MRKDMFGKKHKKPYHKTQLHASHLSADLSIDTGQVPEQGKQKHQVDHSRDDPRLR
jgi:hypothetical protein